MPYCLLLNSRQLTSLAQLLQPYVEPIFQLLHIVWQDQNRSEGLLRSSMGVIGQVIYRMCCFACNADGSK